MKHTTKLLIALLVAAILPDLAIASGAMEGGSLTDHWVGPDF